MPKQHWLSTIATILAITAAPETGRAQAPADPDTRVRVSASVGGANLFRIEDRSFGTTFNFGGGAAVRLHRHLWLELEVNRFAGLEPEPAPCGLVNVQCTGGGRTGYRSATVGSVGLTYEFGSQRIRAAVTGGYGFIRAQGFETTTFADTGQQIEQVLTDDGWGPSAGVSVRVALGPAWSLEPAIRIYGAGGPNLTVLRASVALSRAF